MSTSSRMDELQDIHIMEYYLAMRVNKPQIQVETQCLTQEARHRRLHTEWLHLYV